MLFYRKRLKTATKEDDERFCDVMEEEKVTFKDRFAMALSAFFVIVVPCFLILLGISLLALWLFGAL